MSVYLWAWIISAISGGLLYAGVYFAKKDRPAKSQVVTATPRRPKLRHPLNRPPMDHWGNKKRLDHSPFYMCIMIALFVGGLLMLACGPIHPSTIDAMEPGMQRAMALVLCLGTGT